MLFKKLNNKKQKIEIKMRKIRNPQEGVLGKTLVSLFKIFVAKIISYQAHQKDV